MRLKKVWNVLLAVGRSRMSYVVGTQDGHLVDTYKTAKFRGWQAHLSGPSLAADQTRSDQVGDVTGRGPLCGPRCISALMKPSPLLVGTRQIRRTMHGPAAASDQSHAREENSVSFLFLYLCCTR